MMFTVNEDELTFPAPNLRGQAAHGITRAVPVAAQHEVKRKGEEGDQQPMEWTFPDGKITPEGGDRTFKL